MTFDFYFIADIIQIFPNKGLRAIFCKSHPTCDSRVIRISSYFNQLKIKVILEYGRNFSFIRHFVEFLGGRETTVVFQEMQSVSTSYILKPPQSLRIVFQNSSYFCMNLVRNWTQLRKINTFTFGNNAFLLVQIINILKIWQNLSIVSEFLKVFMSSSLMFKFMSTELFFLPWAFPVRQNNLPFNVSLLGPKYRVFVKVSHVKLFMWIKIYKWAQTETSNSRPTVSVVQWYFENRNNSVGLWQLFWQFIVENLFLI